MVSKAIKERLRKLRQKYGLGEYKKSPKSKRTKTIKIKKQSGGIKMSKKRSYSKKGGFNGMSIIKSALIGIGSAHISGYIPINVPFKEEAAGGIGAFITNRNVKSAVIGAGAVYLTKMFSSPSNSSTSSNTTTGSW